MIILFFKIIFKFIRINLIIKFVYIIKFIIFKINIRSFRIRIKKILIILTI